MKWKMICGFVCMHIGLLSLAQHKLASGTDTSAAAKFLNTWTKNLFDPGISVDGDSLHINEEAKKLILDSQYRKNTYPEKYNWPQAIQLLNNMDLKKAFWHMLNLYRTDTTHRTLVVQTFIIYDSVVDMEKLLVNSFYTYALTDPEVCVFKNGKPNIVRPDILEKKLNDVKEITAFIVGYRSRKQKAVR